MCRTSFSRRDVLRLGAGALVGAGLGGALAPATGALGSPRVVPTTRLQVIRPVRLVDTRVTGPWTRLDANRLVVRPTDVLDIPLDAVAVALTVTAIGGTEPGRVGVGPLSSGPMPSSGPGLTIVHGAGDRRAHGAFVRLGAAALEVHHDQAATEVVIDVVGWFGLARSSTWGRVIATPTRRVFDTRSSAGPLTPGQAVDVALADVPAGASAVLLNVTGFDAPAAGSWQVFSGDVVPSTTNLELVSGSTRAAFAVVPLLDGGLRLRSQPGGHATVDVVGHVTGRDAPLGTTGLFVPDPPRRVLDTRSAGEPVAAGTTYELRTGPEASGALALTVTAVDPDGDGSVGAAPAGGSDAPVGSTLELRRTEPGRDGTVGNFAITTSAVRGVAVGPSGTSTHLVVDVHGWFVGERHASTTPAVAAVPYGIRNVRMERFADEWLDYGTSADGRPLRAFRVGSGPRHAVVSAGIHGDEHTGTSVIADLAVRGGIDGWTLWLVPVANPDARAVNRRFVRDVDMNRDFPVGWAAQPNATASGCITTLTGPAPTTLVETRALAEAMRTGPFRRSVVSISHHDNYNWVAPQRGSSQVLRELADEYASTTGLRRPGEGGQVVPTSPSFTNVPGGFETFAHDLGMASFLVENRAGYVGGSHCAGEFGLEPLAVDVDRHHDALRSLLNDGRLS